MPITRCSTCNGEGLLGETYRGRSHCPACDGVGFFGIDPAEPCEAAAGSMLRVAWMAARDRAGISVWNPADSLEMTDNRQEECSQPRKQGAWRHK